MHRDYADIRSKINEEPQWFDDNAVPRYCQFHPSELDIYAREAALVLIGCQNCRTRFKVAFCRSQMDDMRDYRIYKDRIADYKPRTLAQNIREKTIHYGDPPNIHCCASGPTMGCDDIRVLEYWHKVDFEWVRDQSLEINLDD